MSYSGFSDFTGGTELTAAQLNAIVDSLNALFPIGCYMYLLAAATTTENLIGGIWLECNAVAVSRTTYPALNTKMSGLGYPFGNGDGSTTFNLPDAQGRALVAMAASGNANANALGDSDGLSKSSRNPKPSVSVSGTTGSEASHTHGAGSYAVSLPATLASPGSGTAAPPPGSVSVTGTSGAGSSHSHSFSGSSTVPGWYLVGGILCIKAFA